MRLGSSLSALRPAAVTRRGGPVHSLALSSKAQSFAYESRCPWKIWQMKGKTAVVNNQQVLPTDTLPLKTRRPQPCIWTDVCRQESDSRGKLEILQYKHKAINFAHDVFLLSSFLFLKRWQYQVDWQTLPACSGSHCSFLAVISKIDIFKETEEIRIPKGT